MSGEGANRATRSTVAEIRRRARRHIDEGAVVQGYGADANAVVAMLNDALATEVVCALRYMRHHYMAQGMASPSVAAEFLEHAREEQGHADRLAKRITQLNGAPDLDPATLTKRSHAEYIPGTTLAEMIREDLVAERIAIESYREMIDAVGEGDPVTRRLLEDILATEEEHATEMHDLLGQHAKT